MKKIMRIFVLFWTLGFHISGVFAEPTPSSIKQEWLACKHDADCDIVITGHGCKAVNKKFSELLSQSDPISVEARRASVIQDSPMGCGSKVVCLDGACTEYQGLNSPGKELHHKSFVSVNPMDAAAKGMNAGRWAVNFINDSEWIWEHSGVEESGTYVMNESGVLILEVKIGNSSDLTGSFDPDSGRLIWDHVPYRLITEDDLPPKYHLSDDTSGDSSLINS